MQAVEETLGRDRVCSNEIRRVQRVLGTANEAEKIGKWHKKATLPQRLGMASIKADASDVLDLAQLDSGRFPLQELQELQEL